VHTDAVPGDADADTDADTDADRRPRCDADTVARGDLDATGVALRAADGVSLGDGVGDPDRAPFDGHRGRLAVDGRGHLGGR